ncbi:hypothetical protein [Paractinoplanes lichenicola]|uniref:Uncharacterized protein n=1 Tax=Paractinoplanes lichenicola TaxID=2802976 RepID=A0ABS1VY59_9ACTN|nr:hypothetical protein [Actinoplanes lichenicola]MBL7259426.1 hypothetical protein [Actinoplanes lichenicola]
MRTPYRIAAVIAAVLCALTAAGQPAAADARLDPHTWLSGQRVQAPGGPAIYLVDPEGYRRWIPDPATYDNLFRNWDGVIQDPHLGLIPERDALTSGAFLAIAQPRPQVYLVSNGVKRWITSPAVMDKYNFSWEKIQKVSPLVLDAVPEGAPWS